MIETMLDGVFEFVGFGLLFRREMGIGKPARQIHFIAVIMHNSGSSGVVGLRLLAAKFIVAGIGHGAHQPGFE